MLALRDISSFYLVWPWMLLLLLFIPFGWALYLRQVRSRLRQRALNFSHAAVLAKIHRQPAAWKRVLAPSCATLLAACLILALARPTVVGKVPVNAVDMMLVLDISLSMMADDISPNRIEAAKEAAIRFVQSLPRDCRIGLEVFAGDNYVLSPPTSHHDEVEGYLRALRKADLKPRTEMGSALVTALRILKQAETQPEAKDLSASASPESATPQTPRQEKRQEKSPKSPQQPSRVVILLSDGDSHEGYPWDQAARDALKDNVIVNTIGIGTRQGGTINYRGMELPVNFDETTLRRIAEIANGSYFRVYQQNDFHRVYKQIRDRTIHYEEREVDLAFVLAGLGLLTLVGGLALALLL
jgi:Ca-activated chloride channel family protein